MYPPEQCLGTTELGGLISTFYVDPNFWLRLGNESEMGFDEVVVIEGRFEAEVLQQGHYDWQGFELGKLVAGTTPVPDAERNVGEGVTFFDQVQVESLRVKSVSKEQENLRIFL